MKTEMIKSISLAMIVFSVVGCTNDSLLDLEAIEDIDTVTYTENVKSIIDNNCIFCHGTTPTNGAPMSLATFEDVKEAVLNRDLLNRISRPEGSSGAMPLGGPRLSQSNINIINQWNLNGLQE